MHNITFRKAEKSDIKLVINLQNTAFEQDFIRYGNCPSYNRQDSDVEYIIDKHYAFIIYVNNIPVGTAIVKKKEDGQYRINSLGIIPKYQHTGIGSLTIQYIEHTLPNCKSIVLDTPKDKIENVTFYKKLGFEITGEDNSSATACYLFLKEYK